MDIRRENVPPEGGECEKKKPASASKASAFMKRNGKTVAAIAVIGVAVALVTYIILAMTNPLGARIGSYDPSNQVCETVRLVDDASAEQACAHEWRDDYRIEHVDAQTHEVVHPATYKTIEALHTVCNVCGAPIDGKTAEHAAETGHEGYTTSVPVAETVLDAAEWTETVTDVPAEDVLVYNGRVCKVCGEAEPVDAPEAG